LKSPLSIGGLDVAAGRARHLRRAGVCVATGYGIKLQVLRGQLHVEDGVGRDRRCRVFSRATHGISRLVVIGSDGYLTLEAVRWLHRLGIQLIHLDRDGSLLASSATAVGDARLRRQQALAAGGPLGVEVARSLMEEKLAGQRRLLTRLDAPADLVEEFERQQARLDPTATLDEVLAAEREAAQAYWSAWGECACVSPLATRRRCPSTGMCSASEVRS